MEYFPCSVLDGAIQLTSQPLDGDILVIAAGCTVSISGAISVTNTITINIYGQLKFPSTSDRLNMATGSRINVYSGGSITAASNSNQIKIGPGGADWSGPGTLVGPAAVTASGSGSTLPIELVSFAGTCSSNGVQLNWITATEINNDYFLIEKSNNGYNWAGIAKIKGSLFSNTIKKYTYTDYLTSESLVYYRLVQVDIDGGKTVFAPIDVTCGHHLSDTQNKLILFPNPATTELNISLTATTESSNNILTLINSMGQVVFESNLDLVRGVNAFALPINVPQGSYTVLLSSNNAVVPAQKLVVLN